MLLLRLGTRASPLAMHQATFVAHALEAVAEGVEVELVPITTTGDRDMRDFKQIGSRGVFAVELERALEAGEIDFAVHSCKDLALDAHPALEIVALLPREDPCDVLCGTDSVEALALGARIATSSSRRTAALKLVRDDLVAEPIRGNVQTRLQKSRERGDGACMLAAAGLIRLGLEHEIGVRLPIEVCVPEAGQGAIAVQVLAGSTAATQVDWSELDDADTRWAVGIERAVSRALGGGCELPIGVHVQAPLRWAGGGLDVLPRGFAFVELGEGREPVLASCDLQRSWSHEQCVAELSAAAAAAGAPLLTTLGGE